MAKNILPKHWNGSEYEELHVVTKASNVFTNDNKSVQQKIDDFTSHLADDITKSDVIQTTEVNDSTKIPSSVVTHNLQNQINTINSNNIFASISSKKKPSDYRLGITYEYGSSSVYDFPIAATYIVVVTLKPWVDSSIVLTQLAYIGNTDEKVLYMRKSLQGAGTNGWGSWTKMTFAEI